MPTVVFVLAVAVFAQGTSEFMVSGLLDPIAADLQVSVGRAGLLTALFAVGMVLGAPLMAMVAGRWSLRYSACAFLALFGVVHVIGGVATDFGVLLATRVVAAFANAGFLAVGLAAVPRLVRADLVGRAVSVVVAGVTVACIAGVPAGTVLGQVFGWRAAFFAIAVLSAAVLVPVWMLIPARGVDSRATAQVSLLREWAVVRTRTVGVGLVVGALCNAATFAGFTYLGAVASEAAGTRWVPIVLALFGIGSFLGVVLAGRFTQFDDRIVFVGTAGLIGIWSIAALSAHLPVGVAIMAAVSGAVAFAVGSTLIGKVIRAASPAAPRIAGALGPTALNVGAILGPTLAGIVVDHTGQVGAAFWASAGLVALSGSVLLIGWRGRVRPDARKMLVDSE
ncbi:MFS transporter [Nocardia panacis]|uniref:MFS transporter n=1 Tax=Nocardia panacis TaxID=2340916 RepID=A0A3A4K127_9NOCA|nr:MFS transporter [Nocardia panacis]RJO73420.1 MFS transporter [Nocardia panacis]